MRSMLSSRAFLGDGACGMAHAAGSHHACRCAISVCDIGVRYRWWQAGRVLQAGVRVDIDFGVRDYVDRDVGSSYRTVPVYSYLSLVRALSSPLSTQTGLILSPIASTLVRFIGLGGLGLRARDVRLAYKYYSSALSPSRGLGHAHRVNARA